MDAHQAYCLNFLALTHRWGRSSIGIVAAWALSVLGVALTVAAAWLIGRRLALGSVPTDLKELSKLEFWVAIVATVLSYLRFFRFVFDGAPDRWRDALLDHASGRAALAVVSLIGPSVVVLISIVL
jgi:hypothetical protein